MRTGQNPAKKGLPAYRPRRVGIALLSWIPSQDGYFSESLEILKIQIASIHHSLKDFDLVVFDNGSCRTVQEELERLHSQGLIRVLILSSVNAGKTGALNWLLASLPNELIVYADGDVLFRPGWFEAAEKILNAFPRAGLITSQPCQFDILRGKGQAWYLLENEPNISIVDQLLNRTAVDEYARGIGLDAQQKAGLASNPVKVIQNRESDVQAVIGASHMQFLMRRDTARQIIPLPSEYALNRDEDSILNQRVDQMGLLHLSTLEPYVRHLGNRLDEMTLAEIRQLGLDKILGQPASRQFSIQSFHTSPAKQKAFRLLGWLARYSFFNRALRRLYNMLFEFFAK